MLMERAKSGVEVRERARGTCWLIGWGWWEELGKQDSEKAPGCFFGTAGWTIASSSKTGGGKEDGLWFASSVLPGLLQMPSGQPCRELEIQSGESKESSPDSPANSRGWRHKCGCHLQG